LINKKENLDGSLRKRVFDTLSKLQADDTSVGAHVEPIRNAVDERIRSVRVNDGFRALVFRIDGGDETHYVYVGTYQHDEAYDVAATMQLRVNPVNGVLTLIREQAAELEDKINAERKEQEQVQAAQEKAAPDTTGRLRHELTPGDEAAPGSTPVAAADEDSASDATPTVAVAEDSAPAFAGNGITVEVLDRELGIDPARSEEHTSELQSRFDLVSRLLLEK